MEVNLTKKEQKQITEALKNISNALLRNLDEGAENPTIQGTIDVNDENSEVVFEITARKKINK